MNLKKVEDFFLKKLNLICYFKVFSNFDTEEIKKIYDCIDIDNSGGINYNGKFY